MRDEPEYEKTLNAIRCATFFGTPHQGMSLEYFQPIATDRRMKTLIVIEPNSEILNLLRETFARLQNHITFITCLEQLETQSPVRV